MGTPKYLKLYLRSIICSVAVLGATNSEPYKTGFYPSPKSLWSCTHVNSCQKLHTIYQSTYFIEYFIQGNFKYPRIKKIHQKIEKITRFD